MTIYRSVRAPTRRPYRKPYRPCGLFLDGWRVMRLTDVAYGYRTSPRRGRYRP